MYRCIVKNNSRCTHALIQLYVAKRPLKIRGNHHCPYQLRAFFTLRSSPFTFHGGVATNLDMNSALSACQRVNPLICRTCCTDMSHLEARQAMQYQVALNLPSNHNRSRYCASGIPALPSSANLPTSLPRNHSRHESQQVHRWFRHL